MQHYLYNNSDIILRKTNEFTMYSMQTSVCQQSDLNMTSSVIATHFVALGWHNIFLGKLLQNDVFILMDQHIIN